jgi:hypothetical protein
MPNGRNKSPSANMDNLESWHGSAQTACYTGPCDAQPMSETLSTSRPATGSRRSPQLLIVITREQAALCDWLAAEMNFDEHRLALLAMAACWREVAKAVETKGYTRPRRCRGGSTDIYRRGHINVEIANNSRWSGGRPGRANVSKPTRPAT